LSVAVQTVGDNVIDALPRRQKTPNLSVLRAQRVDAEVLQTVEQGPLALREHTTTQSYTLWRGRGRGGGRERGREREREKEGEKERKGESEGGRERERERKREGEREEGRERERQREGGRERDTERDRECVRRRRGSDAEKEILGLFGLVLQK